MVNIGYGAEFSTQNTHLKNSHSEKTSQCVLFLNNREVSLYIAHPTKIMGVSPRTNPDGYETRVIVYVCTCLCTRVNLCVCLCMPTCMNISVRVCACGFCVCSCVYVCSCMPTYMSVFLCACVYAGVVYLRMLSSCPRRCLQVDTQRGPSAVDSPR